MDMVTYLEVSKISIKKSLIIIMAITILVSIVLFAAVSNRYVNNYFDDYIESVYETNLQNIIEYGKLYLTVGRQQKVILNSYIVEPIYYVEIYDSEDNLIINSSNAGNRFVFDEGTMNIEYFEIVDKNEIIGKVAIIRAEKVSYTNTKQIFLNALFIGALIAGVLVILIMSVVVIIIIRYLTKDTKKVVEYATDENIKKASSRISEFSEIITAISGYRSKLALKEKVKKEKFDRILHETKTPITVLKSQLEGASDGIINIDKNRASDMSKEVDKLDCILKDATTIIEGDEPKRITNIVNIDYSNRIEKIVNSLKTRFNKKGISLIYNKQDFVINTDVHILDNALYNLLLNSFKYTVEGNATIKTEGNELIIEDTGIGIAQEEIDKIFKPYFRASNSTGIKGEGLGLYNVKKDLDVLGIKISVDSKIGEYTHFKLIF